VKATEKKEHYNEISEWAAIFYGEAQTPADELKGSNARKDKRIAERLIYIKLGAS